MLYSFSLSVSPSRSYRGSKFCVPNVLCLEFDKKLGESFLRDPVLLDTSPQFHFSLLNHLLSNQFKLIARINVKSSTFPFSDYQLQPGKDPPSPPRPSQFSQGKTGTPWERLGFFSSFQTPFIIIYLDFLVGKLGYLTEKMNVNGFLTF